MTKVLIKEPNSSFSKVNPNLQLAWDSTSIGLLKTCPRKYYLNIIEQWRLSNQALALTFGIMMHTGLEVYEREKALGKPYNECVYAAIRAIMPDLHLLPPRSEESYRNAYVLIRTIVWYAEQFRFDPMKTIMLANGKPAVELSFSFDSGHMAITGEPYVFCGHIDRLAEDYSGLWVLDHKSTTTALTQYYFDKYSPDNQMSLYSGASLIVFGKESRGCVVDGIQLLVGATKFSRGFAPRTSGQLEEWMHDVFMLLKQNEIYAQQNYWPMNDTACDKYGGCPYRQICSKDVSVRQQFLEAEYTRVVWDPLKTREV